MHKSRESSSGRAIVGAWLLLCAVAACAPPPRPGPSGAAVPAPLPPAGAHYRLDDAASDLRVLVYRSGPLARFGHNHVLLARGLTGDLWLAAADAGGRFEVDVPVAGLVVDAPEARAAEGEAFASVPSAEDIDGTHAHLVGASQLDAAMYPRMRVSGPVATLADGMLVHARVDLL